MIRKGFFFLCLVVMALSSSVISAADKREKSYVVIDDLTAYASHLYHELNDNDLGYQPFETALKGYLKLAQEGQIEFGSLLTVIDMSVSANKNRFFLIDIEKEKIVHKSIVAHGRNSGGEYAKDFSNKIGSFKSSIGFYRTGETYQGKHGLSLRLDGLEFSNSNARKRAIVIHAADYVSSVFIEKNGRLGRSLGCPSLPQKDYDQIVEKIKEGKLLFIYYPEAHYLKNSDLLNYSFTSQTTTTHLVESQ